MDGAWWPSYQKPRGFVVDGVPTQVPDKPIAHIGQVLNACPLR